MTLRLAAMLVWALVAAAAVFWSLKVLNRPSDTPAHARIAAQRAPAPQSDFSKVLGADPVKAPPPAASAPAPVSDTRLSLVGVLNPKGPKNAREGIALIAVDGKPAKSFRVGSVVDGNRVLQSVSLRSATLGSAGGAAEITLSIPAPSEAQRGRPGLPMAPGFAGAAGPPPPPAPPNDGGMPSPATPRPPQLPEGRAATLR